MEYGKFENMEGFSISPVLLHPASKGTIRLSSRLPSDRPLIDPNYLSKDMDVQILIDGKPSIMV